MGTHERRMAIWNTLCQRKQDTAGHLAAEFHVSLRTFYYDLEYLSLIYPLEVIRGRYTAASRSQITLRQTRRS